MLLHYGYGGEKYNLTFTECDHPITVQTRGFFFDMVDLSKKQLLSS
jgi:hypothetical protein